MDKRTAVCNLGATHSAESRDQQLDSFLHGLRVGSPADLLHGAPRVAFDNEALAQNNRLLDVDLVEEARIAAQLQSVRYQQSLKRYHDRYAKPTSFQVRDIVLRRVQRMEGRKKLSAPWEGPFIISEVQGLDHFALSVNIPNSWNVEHLRHFYP